MIVEFSEYQLVDQASEDDSAPIPNAADRGNARMICLPANDRADEITAAMLAPVLEQKRVRDPVPSERRRFSP